MRGSCADLTKSTIHSVSNGRQLQHDDPEILAFEAEQRGIDNAGTMQCNLFSRSSWMRFTLAQLDRRGMLTDSERERTHDQGICLLQRVAHQASVDGREMRVILAERLPLPCGSFEARERIKRETCRLRRSREERSARARRPRRTTKTPWGSRNPSRSPQDWVLRASSEAAPSE